MKPQVLLVEDDASIRSGLERALTQCGFDVVGCASVAAGLGALRERPWSCAVLDLRLPDGTGLEVLREASALGIPAIVVTAGVGSSSAIESMKLGAFEYLPKPFDLEVLLDAVARAARARVTPVQSVASAEAPELSGSSAAMVGVWKLVGRAAQSLSTVLITGETGTGKERVAQAIHRNSSRANRPFVAVNPAGLASSLLESELFGHEKGAFTGAVGRRIGRIEQADGGTLFLDEIGDLDPALQTKLLRFLQDRCFERVGGNVRVDVDVRIIAATSRPVRGPHAALREDLYFRLAVFEILVPPLRERIADIRALIDEAMAGTRACAIDDDALTALHAYGWPGNVRELLHVIERAVVVCGGDVITLRDLPERLTTAPPPTLTGVSLDASLDEILLAAERTALSSALVRAGGNRSQAARLLRISRPRFYARARAVGLFEDPDGR